MSFASVQRSLASKLLHHSATSRDRQREPLNDNGEIDAWSKEQEQIAQTNVINEPIVQTPMEQTTTIQNETPIQQMDKNKWTTKRAKREAANQKTKKNR